MKFSNAMLDHWKAYKGVVFQYEMGWIPAETFLLAHREWNDAVLKFEEEYSAASNYGAF